MVDKKISELGFNGNLSNPNIIPIVISGQTFHTDLQSIKNFIGTGNSGSTSTGLEAIDEGNGIGWRLIGTDPSFYGNIGFGAVDLSISITSGNTFGALGQNSFTSGFETTANGSSSHAEGRDSTANGTYSHAEGRDTTTNGRNSHAEGLRTVADGENSHAEGFETIASGQSSHSEGSGTTSFGNNSHAEGQNTIASGTSSHAEGNATQALGLYSHAEGNGTIAFGNNSHAEGNGTIAFGNNSHAEGRFTQAIGSHSHAQGTNTIAVGTSSHASGFGSGTGTIQVIANGNNSFNHSYVDELGNSGVTGDYSAILGGQNNLLNGENSVILGGTNITGTSNDTVYVPNLNINNQPQTGTSSTALARANDGSIIEVPVSSGSSVDIFVTGGTFNNNTLNFTNNTGNNFNVNNIKNVDKDIVTDLANRATLESGLDSTDKGFLIFQEDSEQLYYWNGTESELITKTPLVVTAGAPFDYFQLLSTGDRTGLLNPVGNSTAVLFDGNTSANVNIGGSGFKEYGVDFGTPLDVGQIRTYFGGGGGGGYNNVAAIYSDDGINWFDAGPTQNVGGGGGTILSIVTETNSHQYWGIRVNVLNNANVRELEFQLRQTNTPAYGSDINGPILGGVIRMPDVNLTNSEETLLIIQSDDTIGRKDLSSIIQGSFGDDVAAGIGGLITGQFYQTDGTGASPLNVAGIVMVKQ